MPSIASHFVVAKLVGKRLNIQSVDYYRGNILPDIIDLENSHFKVKGTYCMIPDIKYYLENYKLDNDLNIGYLVHLLLDKYFLEEYVLKNIKNYKEINLFSPELLYNDYTNMNYLLIMKFKLDINYLNEVMKDFKVNLNKDKYKLNVDSINNMKVYDTLKYIDFKKFTRFLKDVAIKIADDINKYRE